MSRGRGRSSGRLPRSQNRRRLLTLLKPSSTGEEVDCSEQALHRRRIRRRRKGPLALLLRRHAKRAAGTQALSGQEDPTPCRRFLIHDRDARYSTTFDEVFRSEGIEIIRTPIRAPRANGHAERFVGTARRACLDWLLIVNGRQFERVLRIYVEDYNRHRPHRASACERLSHEPSRRRTILPCRASSGAICLAGY